MFSHQAEWREEVKRHFEKIKSEGTCLHRLDEELINRRREELRSPLLLFNINFSANPAVTQSYYILAHMCHIRVCPPWWHVCMFIFSGMLWIFVSTMRGNWRELTISTWSWAPLCCSWSWKRKSCRGRNKPRNSLRVSRSPNTDIVLRLVPGESSPWIKSTQVCSSTTVPDRAAPQTLWTSSSRREMFHRSFLQERGMRLNSNSTV